MAGSTFLCVLNPFLNCTQVNQRFQNLEQLADDPVQLWGKTEFKHLMPVNYSFFHSQFSLFSDMAQTNDEMKETLLELCRDLEKINREASHQNESGPKKSIIDPSTQKIRGRQTRSASSKVNHTSIFPNHEED